MTSLGDRMAALTREGASALYDAPGGGWVQCHACAHECEIAEGAPGTCRVRFNRGGVLRVPWGYVAGAQSDPIEKKPFFHVEPGCRAFSFGMLGCDFKCACCQNWVTSQALRDPAAGASLVETTPEMLVHAAIRSGARAVVSTYNEPLITTEWAVDIFKAARASGLLTGYVSNGHATPRVLDYLAPWIDVFKVDLKGFDELQYRNYGGRLEPVLDTIRRLHAMGIWVEVVTLLVPGLN
ncbi:MAG TPA: radical SAM protein, partial [Vicinamibacterales bacterium]|nr:radical SAM protein [Vicinamibacterales bacterium]